MPATYRVGDAEIVRISEIPLDDVEPALLYPGLDLAALSDHARDLTPGSYDAARGRFRESIHAWLVRHRGRTVLIDTATGNGKTNVRSPVLDHLDEPFLERLAAAGTAPEAVDTVLLTHLHADHVGWNTRREGERWVPTFPNARHLMSDIEVRYNAALSGGEAAPDLPPARLGPRTRTPTPGIFGESVAPVIAAGLADLVTVDGREAVDGFSFHPTPGHSVDHASIRLRSGGEEAWFVGDVMHHPLQVYRPDLASCYCEFLDAAETSRRWMLERAADTGALVFTTHFAETSAGRVTRRGDGFGWTFV